MPLQEEAIKKIRVSVLKWALEHPTDFLWREHFNIPYGSEQHLAVTFIDQKRWFEEKALFELIRESKDIDKGIKDFIEEGGLSNRIEGKDGELLLTEQQEQEKFDNLDIDQFREETDE